MAFVNFPEEQQLDPFPGFHGRSVNSANMTIVHWRIDEGAILPEHSHPHEQVSYIIEGSFEFTVDGETKILRPGQAVIVQSNALHSGRAITHCVMLDTVHPIRENPKMPT